MRLFLALVIAVFPTMCLAGSAALTLDRPSVVVLSTPSSELSLAEVNADGFADFIDDFETYGRALAQALRGNEYVQFIDSNASSVSLLHSARPPITRSSLSGFGIIIFVPGKPPVIFEGVATDHDVLCELQRLLPQAVAHLSCGSNNSFKPKPLRGSA
jgi:hypothetical protein